MENILFKSFPAEMMCQSAAECAFRLHPLVRDRLAEISRITISTQGPAMGIVSKSGPLNNPADRDHCIEYVTAVGLIYGTLNAHHFEDEVAADPRIDQLRSKTKTVENRRYTRDFYAPSKRSSANAVQVRFKDGTSTPAVEIEYPAGHPRRRKEGLRIIEDKFRTNIARHFSPRQQARIFSLCLDNPGFDKTPVNEFMNEFAL
jgi:2-methylcitrate dehydratase PrpD